jgi:hypothetical protein
MSPNIEKMYSIKELEDIFGVPYRTVYYWIRHKKLKAKQGVNRFNVNEWYVSKNDWLEVPAYIRSRYQKKP